MSQNRIKAEIENYKLLHPVGMLAEDGIYFGDEPYRELRILDKENLTKDTIRLYFTNSKLHSWTYPEIFQVKAAIASKKFVSSRLFEWSDKNGFEVETIFKHFLDDEEIYEKTPKVYSKRVLPISESFEIEILMFNYELQNWD